MKFYYQGRLVRTSTHPYTHAVIDMKDGGVVGCRCNETAAKALKTAEENAYLRTIDNCKAAIDALEAGKSYYFSKAGRKSWKIRFSEVGNPTRKKYEDGIKESMEYIEYVRQNWQVVELEAR